MTFSNELVLRAQALLEAYRSDGRKIATAESCTGGLIGALFTDIPGSSKVFERGFITYSNEAKIESLGVDAAVIGHHGAVSAPVAEAMALGALEHSRADVTLAVTGIAGPGGGTAQKPVGTVWFATATRESVYSEMQLFTGSRSEIRMQAVSHALQLLAH
tara:strand:+ start:38 stop:517 length:480 start_codon:yes stop_codon:yes gene_type:complete